MEQQTTKVLVVDDNPEIRDIIHVLLEGEDIRVTEAADGSSALHFLEKDSFDLIILDIMMPGLNGYETCQKIRQLTNVPILFLSARTSDSDKLMGFSSGGDDYLAKPFSYTELLGRTRALIRRYRIYQGKSPTARQSASNLLTCGDLCLDPRSEKVTLHQHPVDLTSTEYQILKLLLSKPHGEGGITVIKIRHIRTKLLLLLFASALLCLGLFHTLWANKWYVLHLVTETNLPISLPIPQLDENFWTMLGTEALNYDIPDSEADTEAVKKLQPLFDQLDDYTGLAIYGMEDGIYRAGQYPRCMDKEQFQSFFDIGYRLTDGVMEQQYERNTKFKNGYATVIVDFYHSSVFIFPYFLFSLFVSVGLFLLILLFFINRKMKQVMLLKQEILRMSAGDLSTPLVSSGVDEIGVLSRELDHLRLTLDQNIRQEQEAHQSNRELIAALSHDLRTPLTVLHGYLDILHLNRNPEMQNTYVTRCLQKTDDIRRLTDRMFEYALVYDASEPEQIRMISFSLSRLLELFREQMDFLELAGFHTDISFPDADTSDITTPDALTIQADPELCKRILNNLFSNILKYGSKQETVTLSMQLPPEINKDAALCLALKNTVKPEHSAVESNRIGLKSSTRNMERMGGKLVVFQTDTFFEVTLSFPVTAP